MRRFRQIAMVFLTLCVVFSAVFTTASAASGTATVTMNVTYRQTEARSMLEMINDFRTGDEAWAWDSTSTEQVYYTGLSELAYDYDLEVAAMQRAAEVALSFSHTRPDGSSCFTAYSWSAAGENIAAGSALDTAEEAFALWQETDESYSGQGHRRNMLTSSCTAVAVACVYYNGCYYWVQEFRSPASSQSATTANNSATDVDVEIDLSDATVSVTSSVASLSLAVGETVSLPDLTVQVRMSSTWGENRTVSAEAKWTVGDSSCLTVSDDGTVTGTAAGSTTLTATVLGQTVTIPVTLTFSTPSVTLANASTGVKVSWGAVTGATSYKVYRKASGATSWTTLETGVTSTSYTDTTAESGVTYYYTVRAVSGSTLSSYVTDKTILYLAQPTVTLSNTSSGVKISWSAVTGASSYKVYRKASGATSWTTLKTGVTSTSYTDTTAESGVTYYYTVRAVSGSTLSSYETTKTIKYLSEPTLTVQNKPGGTRLTWTKSTGASGGYYVYRRTVGGSYTKIASIASGTLTYLDSTAVSGTQYYYAVRAVSSGYLSSYTSKGIVRLDHPTLTLSNASTGVKLTWTKSANCSGYNIYRKTSSGSYTKIKVVTGASNLTWTDTTAESGVTYTYYVCAYKGSSISSYTSKTIKYLSEVTLTVQNKPGGTRLTWTKSTGASGGYYVYRRTVDGSYTKIASIASGTLTYLDSTAVSGTQYYYAVRAVSSGYLSSYTSKTIVRLSHPTLTLSSASTGVKLTWTKVANCSGYNIYRKSGTGSYTKINVVTGASNLTWTDTTAKSGVTYTYYVCAYKGNSTSSYTAKSISY